MSRIAQQSGDHGAKHALIRRYFYIWRTGHFEECRAMMAKVIRNADLFTSDNVTGALGSALNVILHSMTQSKAEFTSLDFIERCVRDEIENLLYWSVERAVHFDGEDV